MIITKGGFYKFNVTIKKIKNGVRKTFRRFWISFGILLFVTIVHRSISLPLIVLRNAIESHWLSSYSPLHSLASHSNLLETNFKIVRNEFIENT